MLASNIRALAVILLAIGAFVAVSGCSDMYHILETYVPTETPSDAPHVNIGDNAPRSSVKDITYSGQGNTLIIRGRGPYNVQAHNDYFTLNKGDATFYIDLKGQGFGCTISMDYTNPYTGSTQYLPIHQFTADSRQYTTTKQVYVPYTCKYCLMVNYGGDWEIRITQ